MDPGQPVAFFNGGDGDRVVGRASTLDVFFNAGDDGREQAFRPLPGLGDFDRVVGLGMLDRVPRAAAASDIITGGLLLTDPTLDAVGCILTSFVSHLFGKFVR